MDNITVNNHTVEIRQYNGQKVLTFKDILVILNQVF